MYATDYFETIILNLARGISATAPAQAYLGLYLSDPGDAGGGTEVAYPGYSRMPVNFSAPAAAGDGVGMQNLETITFAESDTAVGNVTHVAVLDSLTAGNMYLYGQLAEPVAVQAGIAPVVRAGEMQWISAGKLSMAYKAKAFNLLRGTDCPGFTPYLALCNGSPEAGGAEFSGNAYARVPVTFGAPSPQAGGATMISNSALVETAVATGTWGQLTHYALYDAEANGQPYIIDTASIQTTMSKGKAAMFKPNTLHFSIN